MGDTGNRFPCTPEVRRYVEYVGETDAYMVAQV